MNHFDYLDDDRYYGEMTDSINDLKENLEADILHYSIETRKVGAAVPPLPHNLKSAMLYLIEELDRLYPLAVMIDSYMMENARLSEVIRCFNEVKARHFTAMYRPENSIN